MAKNIDWSYNIHARQYEITECVLHSLFVFLPYGVGIGGQQRFVREHGKADASATTAS